MDQLKHTIAIHRWAIILAFLVALIVASPQVIFRVNHAHDGVYQGIELLPDNPWSARVREVMDGHGLGSIYYKDGKNAPYLLQPLGSVTIAYMSKTFGLDINDTFLFSRTLLSFVVFLLIYSFSFLLSRNKLVALSCASALVLADGVMNLSALTQLVQGASPSNFLSISQPVNPAMIAILLFGFLISFWLFYVRGGWRLGILSALLLGLNFYNYFYSWTYLYAFGGVLVLLYLVQKQWSEAVRLGSVFFGALAVAVPYGINLYEASRYPTYVDVGVRLGIVPTHAPIFVGALAIIALSIFMIGFPREDRRKYLFGLALLLTPFITMNQQLLTGKEMQAAHYHWYFHKPIAVLLSIIVVSYLLGRLKTNWYKRVFAILIVVTSLMTGVLTQVASYFQDRGDGGSMLVERQKYGSVMRWLNQHAVKEEVVLSNDPISYLVTIYTPLNVFYHRAAMLTLPATKERLLDTLFTFYRLRGVEKEDARELFYKERGSISTNIYGMYYRQLLGSYEAIPDEEIDKIIDLYTATLATSTPEWLKQKMAQYEVNFVVWDRKENPDWQLQDFSFLKERIVFGNIGIYQVDF